ncbi:hypothetical protein F4677DRAFT_465136 [Hypoxylon crocopeplum]|nr:hypothetical protein F4677DRAFT_465136 [Hypoxylon crocopeplum]
MDLPPAPNGLSNRWNLGLRWGLCSEPGCIARDNLLKCGGCHAILYCSVDHQKADRPQHKSSCNIVKHAREELVKEEAALRARPGDASMPENPFETARGGFWSWQPTRPYMRSRLALTAALLNIKTGVAVETALKHSLKMLQLNPGDNQGVRDQVPGLFLRLGRDQEAYDFIKWYATVGADGDYEWGNPESPFLNLHDEDVFERVDEYAEELFDLGMLVCLTNLKIRLLLDMEWVREDAFSDVLYKRRDIVERADWTDLIADLEGQVKKLVECVKKRNEHYWPALNAPERWAAAYPTAFSPGSPQEINIVFRQTWYTWSECPAAMEVVKKYAGI